MAQYFRRTQDAKGNRRLQFIIAFSCAPERTQSLNLGVQEFGWKTEPKLGCEKRMLTNEEALRLIKECEECFVVWATDQNAIVAVHPIPQEEDPLKALTAKFPCLCKVSWTRPYSKSGVIELVSHVEFDRPFSPQA